MLGADVGADVGGNVGALLGAAVGVKHAAAEVDPAGLDFPIGHGVQVALLVAATAAEYVPTGHCVHVDLLVAAIAAEYVPEMRIAASVACQERAVHRCTRRRAKGEVVRA